mmetsp:Transcript_48148/g.95746  ORF Transcript_48148/g.95746 Transcript_48148/m.95746 type:complete len:111 (+) Transcript_48148:740-1072(+)
MCTCSPPTEPVGQIGFWIVTVGDMGRALEEDSRVAEGIHTLVVACHKQVVVVVDKRHSGVMGSHWDVDRPQVAVGRRQLEVPCRSRGVVEGSNSLLEAHHNQAVAVPHGH